MERSSSNNKFEFSPGYDKFLSLDVKYFDFFYSKLLKFMKLKTRLHLMDSIKWKIENYELILVEVSLNMNLFFKFIVY